MGYHCSSLDGNVWLGGFRRSFRRTTTIPCEFELPLTASDDTHIHLGDWTSADIQCQKLLFSATLTRDPSKIAALSLRSPSYYIVQSSNHPAGITAIGEQFAVPSNLVEKMIVMPPALKPLNLIHLLYAFGVTSALVFTKSVEATVRLETLLTFFIEAWTGQKLKVGSYTAEMKPGERKKVMEEFTDGKIDL